MDLLSEMLQARYELFERQDEKEGSFDITFTFSDGQILRSHKFLLTSLSETFKRMFDEQWTKNNTAEIKFNTYDEFKELLKFCYLGFQAITKDNMFILLEISHCFHIFLLTKACIEFIAKNEIINDQNVVIFHIFAETYLIPELFIEIKKAFTKIFSKFLKTNVFLNASKTFVIFMLEMEKLKMVETDIFKRILEWAKRSCIRKNVPITEDSLKSELNEILPLIRFPTMDLQFLLEELPNYGYLFGYTEIGKIFKDALEFSNTLKVENPKSSFSCIQRMSLNVVISDKNGKKAVAPLLYFDEILNQKFMEIKEMKPFIYKKTDGKPKELLQRTGYFIDHTISTTGSCWRINYKKLNSFTNFSLVGPYFLFLDKDGDLCIKKGRDMEDFVLAQFDSVSVSSFGKKDDVCRIECI